MVFQREKFQVLRPVTQQATGGYVTEVIIASGTSQQSAVMPEGTIAVRLVATEPQYIEIGVDPVAVAPVDSTSTGSLYLPAGIAEFFAIAPNEKVAVLQGTAAGNLFITPVGR